MNVRQTAVVIMCVFVGVGIFSLVHGCAAPRNNNPYDRLNRERQMDKMRQDLAKKMKQYGKSSNRRIKAMEKTLQQTRTTITELKKENRQLRHSVQELQRRLRNAGKDATVNLPDAKTQRSNRPEGAERTEEKSPWESLYGDGDKPKNQPDITKNNSSTPSNTKEPGPGNTGNEEDKPLSNNIKKRLEEYNNEAGKYSSSEQNTSDRQPSGGNRSDNTGSNDNSSNSKTLSGKEKDRIWEQLGKDNVSLEEIAGRLQPHLSGLARWLVEGLFDSNLYRRRNVEKLILVLGKKPFKQHVLRKLKRNETSVQLLRLTGDLHLEDARELLKKFLNSSDADTVYYARRALVQTGHRKSIPHLMKYLAGDGDQLFKMDSHDILKKITGKSFGHPNAIIAKEEENEQKQREWKQWWRTNGSYLYWNGKKDRFVLNENAKQQKTEVDPITGKPRSKSTSQGK